MTRRVLRTLDGKNSQKSFSNQPSNQNEFAIVIQIALKVTDRKARLIQSEFEGRVYIRWESELACKGVNCRRVHALFDPKDYTASCTNNTFDTNLVEQFDLVHLSPEEWWTSRDPLIAETSEEGAAIRVCREAFKQTHESLLGFASSRFLTGKTGRQASPKGSISQTRLGQEFQQKVCPAIAQNSDGYMQRHFFARTSIMHDSTRNIGQIARFKFEFHAGSAPVMNLGIKVLVSQWKFYRSAIHRPAF